MRVCDGTEFRPITLDPLPQAGTLIADYQQQNADVATQKIWPNEVPGGEPLFLGSDAVRITPAPSPPGAEGITRAGGGAAGFSAPIAHGRLTLPARGFSIEIIFTGSDTLFSHGQNNLQFSMFTSPTLREHGRDTRYQPPVTAPDSTRPSHLVYVHDQNDVRHMFLNGRELNLETDASIWTGPYLGGSDLVALGNVFGGPGGGGVQLLHHRVRIHAVALTAAEVLLRCQASLSAPFNVQSCS